jgi:hypothetical protein
MNPSYQVIFWRDIPAQVKVRSGSQRVNRQLSDRFQEAIDAAAMLARTTSTEDYLEEWRASDWQSEPGDAEALADRVAARLEGEYSPARLKALISNRGYNPAGPG